MSRVSVGDIVLFTFPPLEIRSFSAPAGQSQTVPAIIVAAWSDECVNLRVFPDSDGPTITKTSVPLKKPDDGPESGFYWDWPD